MHTAYLLLGGNMENRDKVLQQALDALWDLGRITAVSARKETEPWGFTKPVNSFLNQAVCLETELNPELLMKNAWKLNIIWAESASRPNILKTAQNHTNPGL